MSVFNIKINMKKPLKKQDNFDTIKMGVESFLKQNPELNSTSKAVSALKNLYPNNIDKIIKIVIDFFKKTKGN